jgi:hypothetical protein
MALLFAYSCNNLTASGTQLPGAFAGVVGAPTVGVGDGPGATPINTVHCDGASNGVLVPNIAIPINGNGLCIGAGFKVSGVGAQPVTLYQVGGNVYALYVQVSSDGSMQLSLTSVSGYSSASGVFTFGSRHEVELFVSSFTSANQVSVILDGVPVPGLTNIVLSSYYGGLTGLSDGATIHTVQVACGTVAADAATVVVDSVYALDTTGTVNNAPLGPCISTPMFPSAPGHVSAWSVHGVSLGWEALSVVPPAGDTSYIYDSNPGDQESCALTAVANITAVYGICVIANQRQDTAGGGRTTSLGVGNGSGQNYTSPFATWGLGTTYRMNTAPYSFNPFTDVAWALVDLNTLEVSAKLQT